MAADISSLLSGLLGAGGGGLSPNSSTAQSTPFYNSAGIFFNSDGAGVISGNTDSAQALPRQTAGLNQAYPESQFLPSSIQAGTATNNFTFYIVGGILVIFGLVFFIFKK